MNKRKRIIKTKEKQPKAAKVTTVKAVPSATTSLNSTRKIIDSLKDNYVFRFNRGNQKMEFHLVDETKNSCLYLACHKR